MSTSRLEKFIYAICSMDVSDLPVPLSRIEKLWNCLITGETPDFEPLSRNEKYLMAMLDRYDISNLPAPMSRGEKLLYKIAVGETDLSDVPGYLSRYEELLKYLIENGGIGFEYVLHTLNQSLSTLYNTAEKPVKSAILKGQTLKNEYQFKSTSNSTLNTTYNYNDNEYTVTSNGVKDGYVKTDITVYLEANKKYTFKAKCNRGFDNNNGHIYLLLNNSASKGKKMANENTTFTVPTSGVYYVRLDVRASNEPYVFSDLMILEGNYTNQDIPYFTGMQSVKMPVLKATGKNLFNVTYNDGWLDSTTGEFVSSPGGIRKATDFIEVIGGETYTISGCTITGLRWYDINKKPIDTNWNHLITTITAPTNAKYLRFTINSEVDYNNIQIEKGSISTSYEPYKSNILSASEEIELRGIGDVQDTLDGLTGEVTEWIGEIVLDGSEKWASGNSANWSEDGDTLGFYFKFTDEKTSIACSDKLPSLSNIKTNNVDCFYINGQQKWIGIRLSKSKLPNLTIEGVKVYLQQNPITVQYQLATPTTKTIDLTTVDQDGQPTKLKTFNDISYVEINADNIIPSVDVEVATKISETLSTLGLDHHDISETQDQLGQTIDEQTENTDATMMATTEIYEQTL